MSLFIFKEASPNALYETHSSPSRPIYSPHPIRVLYTNASVSCCFCPSYMKNLAIFFKRKKAKRFLKYMSLINPVYSTSLD